MADITIKFPDLSKDPNPIFVVLVLLALFIWLLAIYFDYAKAKRQYSARIREHQL
jgi:Na+/glutamate symporter